MQCECDLNHTKMASTNHPQNPSLLPEIGPDGLPREAPVIAYTEKIIEQEQLQLRKYIEENYSKIRDVEREFASLNMEMKLTAGPKKAALEHLRKKIEMGTERIRLAKLKEDQARNEWEAASKVVKEEEVLKQKLCEDLNSLVQESSNAQFARLEELKRRLEAMNPSRASSAVDPRDDRSAGTTTQTVEVLSTPRVLKEEKSPNRVDQQASVEDDGRTKKKSQFLGRGKGRGIGAVRAPLAPGWTGAGFNS